MWSRSTLFLSFWILFESIRALPSSDLAFRSFRVGISTTAETAATSISTDDNGNTYIVGNTYGSFGKSDVVHLSDMSIFIAKFSRSGILIWLKRTGSAFPDQAFSAFYFGAVLYVTGTTKGSVSDTASPADGSVGIQDGFVLAYDSFTGQRIWSRQIGRPKALTEVNAVTVSSLTGVLISGHTNASLFGTAERKGTEDEIFIARLNHASGRIEQNRQHPMRPTAKRLTPRQMITTKDNRYIHVVVEVDNHTSQKKSVLFSLLEEDYSIFTFNSTGSKQMSKVSEGLVEDTDTGKIVVSYSVAKEEPHASRDFGLQTLSLTPTKLTGPMEIANFDSRTDDICKGIVLNEAGYALMLGTVSKEGEDASTIGVWIYDMRNNRTIGFYKSSKEMLGSSMRVAGFTLDDMGHIVFAGVRIPDSGKREIMLGTFGIPLSLQRRTHDGVIPLPSDLDGTGAGNAVVDVNQSAIETTASQSGLFAKGPNGKLGTAGILVICLCATMFIVLLVVGLSCFVRVHRAQVDQK